GEERRHEAGAEGGLGERIESCERAPSEPGQESAQRKEVIVLALVPQTIIPEAVQQVSDQPRLALDHARGELLVLEPRSDGGERGVVPGLPVRETFVELA